MGSDTQNLVLGSILLGAPGVICGIIWLSIETGSVNERGKEDLEKQKKGIGIAAAVLLGYVALMWIFHFAYAKRAGRRYGRYSRVPKTKMYENVVVSV